VSTALTAYRCPLVAPAAASAEIKRLTVRNAGWELAPLAPGEESTVPDSIKIRGFKLVKHDAGRVLEFKEPGHYVVDEA
jgi:hypothetical protein